MEAMQKNGHYLRDRQYRDNKIEEAKDKGKETPREQLKENQPSLGNIHS